MIIITFSNYSFECGWLEFQYYKSKPAAYGFLFMHRIQWRATFRQ